MASQRILLLALGGQLADEVWQDIRRWSDARVSKSKNEWSSDDWAPETRREIDAFLARISASAFTPPVLYRSEHVDCWLTGCDYDHALVVADANDRRQLLGDEHQVIAAWVRNTDKFRARRKADDETRWLYARLNEAATAWQPFAERRLILLVRYVLGGFWEDEEVTASLQTLPDWWTAPAPEIDPVPEEQQRRPWGFSSIDVDRDESD